MQAKLSNVFQHFKQQLLADVVSEHKDMIASHTREAISNAFHTGAKTFSQQYSDEWLNQYNYDALESELNAIIKNDDNTYIVDAVCEVVKNELQYVYKNAQIITVQDDDFEFFVHDSACPICKFLSHNHDKKHLKEHFAMDCCDSYLMPLQGNLNTSNLLSHNIRIYNIPNVFKNSVANLYQTLKIKYPYMIKDIIKITCLSVFDNTLPENVCFAHDIEHDMYYIKPTFMNYRHDFVMAFLNFEKTAPEMVKDIYYKKISKSNDIDSDNKFISFMSRQNADMYYHENCVWYALEPWRVRNSDEPIYNYLVNHDFAKRISP